ncbi:MAG: hypothetical protein ACK4L7_02315 [Flavobacteriales bacterium]
MPRLLSILLHPLIMPALTLWAALRIDPHLAYFIAPGDRWKVLAMVGLMTIGFPLASALLLMRAGLLSSLEMPRRHERIAPYAMTLMYYGMTAYLLARTPLHPMVQALFVGAALALLATTLITLRWKISAHMVGIGGLLGALVALNAAHGLGAFMAICAAIIAAGALGTARLLSSDHTPAQVHAGAALGFCAVFAAATWAPALLS